MSVAEMTRPAEAKHAEALALVTDEVIEAFWRDGAVWIPGLLSPAWMQLIELGVKRNIKNPGPLGHFHFEGQEGEYWDDYCNFEANPEYQRLLADSPIAAVGAKLLRSENLYLYCDQIFVKEGGYSRRTRWHQDIPWWVAEGKQMASMWIALDPLNEAETLEYIRGKDHPIYDHGVTGTGEALPAHNAPPIPDFQSEREKWPIVSHSSRPGDVLIFHPATIHGGGEMREGGRRRSLSLRFVGDDAIYVQRPLEPDPAFPGITEALRPGDPLRHSWFPQVYPQK